MTSIFAHLAGYTYDRSAVVAGSQGRSKMRNSTAAIGIGAAWCAAVGAAFLSNTLVFMVLGGGASDVMGAIGPAMLVAGYIGIIALVMGALMFFARETVVPLIGAGLRRYLLVGLGSSLVASVAVSIMGGFLAPFIFVMALPAALTSGPAAAAAFFAVAWRELPPAPVVAPTSTFP